MQSTAYVIKPDGMPHRDEIRQMVQDAGLTIVQSAIVTLPRWLMRVIYPGLSEERLEFINRLMTSSPVEVGILEGYDAIRTFYVLVGESIDPGMCAPGTIRYRLGLSGKRGEGEEWYFYNAIHRPRNQKEATRDIHAVRRLF